LDVKYGAKSCP